MKMTAALALALSSMGDSSKYVIRAAKDSIGMGQIVLTGNDKIRSGNRLSQKSRRKRRRQYLSQSFRKGGAA